MKELFGITHVGEEDVPNAKCLRVWEEEVSLSQPVTVAVPPEEEEVLVPQGPAVMVPPGEEEPPKEEEVLAPPPPYCGPIAGLRYRGPLEEEVLQGPHVAVLPEEEEVPAPYRGPTGRKEMPCLGTTLGKFFTLLFSQKYRRFFSPFFLLNAVDL
jgi:hypothetical protein